MSNTFLGFEGASMGEKKYFLHEMHILVIENGNYQMMISSKKKNMIGKKRKKDGTFSFFSVI